MLFDNKRTCVSWALSFLLLTASGGYLKSHAGCATHRAEVPATLGRQQMPQVPVLNRNFTNQRVGVPDGTTSQFERAPSEKPQQPPLVNRNGQEFARPNYRRDGMTNNGIV